VLKNGTTTGLSVSISNTPTGNYNMGNARVLATRPLRAAPRHECRSRECEAQVLDPLPRLWRMTVTCSSRLQPPSSQPASSRARRLGHPQRLVTIT
jgi:hypothetical protein